MSWDPARHPAVAMPVGGIGTGSMAIGSDGGWRQMQLHNVGNHHGDLPGTFMALRTMQHEPVWDSTVVLQSARDDVGAAGHARTPMVDDDVVPAWQNDLVHRYGGTATSMKATYPVARIVHDTDGPVHTEVSVTSPMVPCDVESSALPLVLVDVRLTNRTHAVARTWLAHSVHNAVGLDPHLNPRGVLAPGYGGNTNALRRGGASAAVHLVMENPGIDPLGPWSGQMVLSCQAQEVVALPCFTEVDELMQFLNLLAPWGDHSRLSATAAVQAPQNSAPAPRFGPSPPGRTWLGALVGYTELQPGESRNVRFALAWYFPNRMVDFVQFGPDRPEHGATRFWLGNHYARRWPDALSVAAHAMSDWDGLWRGAEAWTGLLDRLPLPELWRTHLAAQVVPLRTPTVFRAHDGAFFGFEGALGASTRMWSGDVGGSCPMNCTHVWNYAAAAAAVFPEIERSMRETELDITQAPSGAIPHRVYVPTYLRQLGDGPIGGPDDPALDGMCGTILKTYRELRRGAVDIAWVRMRWPRLIAVMDHIAGRWDPDGTGLLQGPQPSTHDIALLGANTFMGTYWLAALRAAEELAILVEDSSRAADWRARFEHSSCVLDETCFRDGYYVQVLGPGESDDHQWGSGCLSDQLIGQWWAHQLALGHLLPVEHVRQALSSIVRHNLRDDATTATQRPFAVAGERGLLVCTWPRGGRPRLPTAYCDEVWTGTEYQVAAHCLHEGMTDEADRILQSMWARHDGRRRNPFNEVECGDHYVRSMAGWSVLEAALGLSWNALDRTLSPGRGGHVPVLTGTGWGEVEVTDHSVRIRALGGTLDVRRVQWGDRVFCSAGAAIVPDGWVHMREEG